jgi:cytochrome b6-f complex iron-sulfur subunit
MISRYGWQTRFATLFATILSFSANPSFADQEPSPYSSAVSTIISIGVAGFSLLFLYVAFLTVTFLIKVFKEAAQARKEASAHAAPVDPVDFGEKLLTFAGWVFALLTLVTIGTLLAGSMGIAAGADILYAKNPIALIVTLGVCGFLAVALYLVVFLLFSLWKSFFPASGDHGHTATGTASDIPLNPEITRRSFLSLLGWAWVAFTAATMGALSTCLRFAFPNVTFEPPLKFAAGFPDSYSMGVDERFKDGHRVWIVRNQQGFYALSTICTHLGCTPDWLSNEQKFKCPCHGSGYYITGVNFEGPTPRPLERFQITLADDGQILVDESVKFQQELGQWGMPGSFLEYKA